MAGEPKHDWPFIRPIVGPRRPPRRLMYDSIDLGEIPPGARAVAGYVGGRWPTFPLLAEGWPRARRLSIAVNARELAACLDVERGDARPADAPAWVHAALRRGIRRPVVYCSVSAANDVIARLHAAGIPRRRYRLWTAHYTGKAHLCSSRCYPPFVGKADCTQYDDRAGGRDLDVSLYRLGFFAR